MAFGSLGITSDHAGKELRLFLLEHLLGQGLAVQDYGVSPDHKASVDYPDYAALLASNISEKKIGAGIAICGTGLGMAVAANKFPGVRATSVWDEYSARMSRAHNDSNVICLGARTLNPFRALDLLQVWLDTAFLGERHQLRLDKITVLEKTNFK